MYGRHRDSRIAALETALERGFAAPAEGGGIHQLVWYYPPGDDGLAEVQLAGGIASPDVTLVMQAGATEADIDRAVGAASAATDDLGDYPEPDIVLARVRAAVAGIPQVVTVRVAPVSARPGYG